VRFECGIWLSSESKAFDTACADILVAVGRSGSMHQAATELGISGCWAWRTVRAAEKALGFPLLDCNVGGKQGGGSRLTAQGRELLDRYVAARKDAGAYSTKLYERHFRDWDGAETRGSARAGTIDA
jgi:molybdate transport repressor ModE-like protein